MQYNRNYLRLWFRCWSSPFLFSLIFSLVIECPMAPTTEHIYDMTKSIITNILLTKMMIVIFCFSNICTFGGASWSRTSVLLRYLFRSSNKIHYIYLCLTSFRGLIQRSLVSLNNNGFSFSTAIMIMILFIEIPVRSSYAIA